jgi:cyclopropane fatty-acyl-phospholipid synthase-like methyltransferase
MLWIKTANEVAVDSPDHLYPEGTKNDNTTSELFIDEVEYFFKTCRGKANINFMDLGCAGGQLVVDFAKRGHLAVGLEGSDYNIKNNGWNWPEYYQKNLFTCDITKPYEVYNDNERVYFDMITAWEVIEHISEKELYNVFFNIACNLKNNGIFVASISTQEGVNSVTGHVLHQSVHDKETWGEMFRDYLLTGTGLCAYPYFFRRKVRNIRSSLYVTLIKTGI